jgi:hypothetical protein
MKLSNNMHRTRWLVLGAVGLLAATALAADPAWWTSRGAVNSNTNPYAVVNQGQLKAFTAKAVQELDADLAGYGGAGSALDNLVASWHQDYATGGYGNTSNPTPPYKSADFQAVTIGQLKQIAFLLYSRLDQAGYATALPSWIALDTSGDKSAATIGQLKTVFNLDLNGLPASWNLQYFGQVGVNPAGDADSDGLDNLTEYLAGTNPTIANGTGTAFIATGLKVYTPLEN